LSTNEPRGAQTIRDEYFQATRIIDAEYKLKPPSLDDVIKTCENLHLEENYQLKKLLQNMNIFLMER
jgi:hypothetical protein